MCVRVVVLNLCLFTIAVLNQKKLSQSHRVAQYEREKKIKNEQIMRRENYEENKKKKKL